MSKILSIVIAAMFAAVSLNVMAASHAGAQKDDKKMEKKGEAQTKDGKKVGAKEEKKK